jgi:hypothetical protein
MEPAMMAIRTLMIEVCGLRKGVLCVGPHHVALAVKTRKHQNAIGLHDRADKIRGWLAGEVDEGRALLLVSDGISWLGPAERKQAVLRLRILYARTVMEESVLKLELECLVAMGSVLTWAAENEEPPRKGAPVILRKEKRAQLRTGRHRLWSLLGPGSLNATVMMLVLEESAYPEVDPGGADWIQAAAEWIVGRGWINRSVEEVAVETMERLEKMRLTHVSRDGHRSWDLVLDLGEGWGSIGTAAAGVEFSTVGVDNAGVLYQGTMHGYIRSRVQLDFAAPSDRNLLQRISKKAELSLPRVMVVWLSPECTLLSRANNMNTSRGCAHGPYAEHPDNLAVVTPERLQEERAMFQKCKMAIEEQLRALEEEDVLFAIENPKGSHFWELESVTGRLQRLKGRNWRIEEVDQCAYGRKAQKETWILTNIEWKPMGLTGDGKCKVGVCSGTLGNIAGQQGSGRHEQQTVANSAERRTKVGEGRKGERGQYSVKAAKNRVETMLVQEILVEARQQKIRILMKRKRGEKGRNE